MARKKDKDTDIEKEIGRKVAEIRFQRQMTQEDLAAEAEIDRSYLSEIENGHKNMSIRSLKKIAQALGVKVSVLLGE